MPDFVKSDIKLTIGILVSNNIKYIRKGLESITQLLEAVPSELIVVDTVGEERSDGSLAVAREYTDKVYHFDWVNDFSAARNVALEVARGEWFMFFDDDEYFDDVTELIDFFRSEECERYNSGTYFSGNYIKPGKMQKTIVARLVRRTEETRFVGIIHEYLYPSYTPIKQFNTFTHHFGYLFESEEQKKAKRTRNIPLLEKDIEDHGLNVSRCAELVQEIYTFDKEEAMKKCSFFIRELEKSGGAAFEDPLGQWLLLEKARYMNDQGSLEGMLEVERELLSKYRLMETARLVLAYLVADAAFYNEKWELVSDRVSTYFELYDWLCDHEEERNWQARLDLVTFMIDDRLFEAARMGLISENRLKDHEKAYFYIGRMDYDFCEDKAALGEEIETALIGLQEPSEAVAYFGKIYRDEFLENPALRKYLPAEMAGKLEEYDRSTRVYQK